MRGRHRMLAGGVTSGYRGRMDPIRRDFDAHAHAGRAPHLDPPHPA
jgi:hypothetical protein